jgi:hypothetical protein
MFGCSYYVGGVICNIQAVSLWEYNQEMFLVGDPGAVSVCLFCPVESGELMMTQ